MASSIPAHPKAGSTKPWRDNIEALTMAIVLALMLKVFLVEAYKIPTGSMQPTLMGLGDPLAARAGLHVSDRILVDKLSPYLFDPERFQVVVFKYPLDRSKNFVKRICGMPGEFFRILNGDLWTRADESQPWTMLARPERVLNAQLKRLLPTSGGDNPWAKLSGADQWTLEARSINMRGDGKLRFGQADAPILDRYFDGYPDSVRKRLPALHPRETNNRVGDLRLTGRISALAGEELLEFELQDGSNLVVFELPGPAAPAGAKPAIRLEARSPLGSRVGEPQRFEGTAGSLPAGRSVRFQVENLDDRARLLIDGDLIAEAPVPPQSDADSRVRIASRGAGADLSELMLYRDIYYLTGEKHSDFKIPEGQYLVLGDNTQDSSDSREWMFARYELLNSEASSDSAATNGQGTHDSGGNDPAAAIHDGPETLESRILRGNLRHQQNPAFIGNVTWLEDEWGERHALAVQGAPRPPADQPTEPARGLPPEAAPFVPRDLIVGRAIAVFWPLSPSLGLYRFKWVR
jgi:signal peptidase I